MAKDHDWAGAKKAWVTSTSTFETVGKKLGIPPGLMRKRAGREGWKAEREEFSRRVEAEVTEELIETTVKDLKEWNTETLTEARRLREAARSLFMRKRTDGRWIHTTKVSAQGLQAAAAANMTADKLARLALGASTDNQSHRQLPASVDDFV